MQNHATDCAEYTNNSRHTQYPSQHFLQDTNLDVETYMDALKISKRGPNVILQHYP